METVTIPKAMVQECYRLMLVNLARLILEQRAKTKGIDRSLDKELNDTAVITKQLGTVMRAGTITLTRR